MDNDQQHFDTGIYKFNQSRYEGRTLPEMIPLARRNQERLTELINRLFEHHSRLLVVRIDLGYRKDAADGISLEMAQMHREQLLRDRRNYPRIFNGLVGHAWSFERGEQKGYHFHFLAIFDGARRHDGVGIGMAIGELWRKITRGNGQRYISNFDKKK